VQQLTGKVQRVALFQNKLSAPDFIFQFARNHPAAFLTIVAHKLFTTFGSDSCRAG
jgi:hypothetical protein